VEVTFDARRGNGTLGVEARVRTVDKTGVEMEALTAVTVAALTIYDMVKALEKGVTIARVELVEKSGGKSGTWTRAAERSRAPSRAGHPRSKPASRTPLQ